MKIRLAVSLVILAVITRLALNLLPYPPHNFSPIATMGLFGAACFDRKWMALALPFAGLFLSDLFLNNVLYREFYTGFTLITSWWIYAAFGLVMLLGWVTLRQQITPGRLIPVSIGSSLIFFFVTNFSVWYEGTMYPHTGAGLSACLVAGLPFLSNTVLGDLFFSSVLFGTYYWMLNRQKATQQI
ncbi:MAG: hypothetical protein JNJ57_13230 [Saprospiraceae bacterium]|nr:hypothetical protein [Saprospiraceae bacterium]